ALLDDRYGLPARGAQMPALAEDLLEYPGKRRRGGNPGAAQPGIIGRKRGTDAAEIGSQAVANVAPQLPIEHGTVKQLPQLAKFVLCTFHPSSPAVSTFKTANIIPRDTVAQPCEYSKRTLTGGTPNCDRDISGARAPRISPHHRR